MSAYLTLNYKLPVKDMSKHTGGPNEPHVEWNSWTPGNFTHPYPIYPLISRNENKAWKDRHLEGRLHTFFNSYFLCCMSWNTASKSRFTVDKIKYFVYPE